MPVKYISMLVITLALFSAKVYAEEGGHGHHDEIYHAVRVEFDAGRSGQEGALVTWDIDGWVGTDENRFAFKSEGERANGVTETAEFWGMYSRMVSDFWNVQAGLRHDTRPMSTSYAVLGFEGLAPYFVETEAHLFLSDDGDLSARITQERDFLLTQRAIIKPYFEANIYAQDVPELDKGAGLSDAEIGLQTRYEITRNAAPYFDIRYERKFGETSSVSKSNGEDNDAWVGAIGMTLLF